MKASIKYLLICLVLLLATSNVYSLTISLGGADYVVADHPRILINPSILTKLRTKANNNNIIWQGLVSSADDFIISSSTKADPYQLFNYALIYLVDPVSNLSYGEKAKTMLMKFTDPDLYDASEPWESNDNRDYGSIDLMYIACAWDWIYDLLTLEDKKLFLTWINDTMLPMIYSHQQIAVDYPNGLAESNLSVTKWAGELMFAMATLEDNTLGNQYGEKYSLYYSELIVQRKYNFWLNELKPIREKYFKSGHLWDGTHYTYNRTAPFLLRGLQTLLTSVSIDEFSSFCNDWLPDIPMYFIHREMPDNLHFYSEGRYGGGIGWNRGRTLEAFLWALSKYPTRNESKFGQYFINHVFEPSMEYRDYSRYIHRAYAGIWFMLYDPSQEELDYSSSPKYYLSDGLPVFFSRTAWKDSAATHIGFVANDYILGDVRQGINIGSYKIFKKDHLLYENGHGAAGGTYDMNQHNVVFLDDGYIVNGWGSSKYSGGFYQTGGTYMPDGEIHTVKATIDKTMFNDYFHFVRSDLTDAYVYNKIEKYHRYLIHVLPSSSNENDYIILFDRIKSVPNSGIDGKDVLKTSFLHVPKAPIVSGNEIVNESPDSVSKLFTKVLLPENAVITVNNVQDNTEFVDNDDAHRVEIKASTLSQKDNFLYIHFPSASMTATMPDMELVSNANGALNTNNMIGAIIHDNSENKVVLFGNDFSGAVVTSNIEYTIVTSTLSRHILFDLQPNTLYSINISDGSSQLVESSNSGVLMFFYSNSGEYTYSISKEAIGPKAPVIKDIKIIE